MTAITRWISEFAAGISFDKVPTEVIARTGMLLMDSVGIALRARHDAPAHVLITDAGSAHNPITPAAINSAATLFLQDRNARPSALRTARTATGPDHLFPRSALRGSF